MCMGNVLPGAAASPIIRARTAPGTGPTIMSAAEAEAIAVQESIPLLLQGRQITTVAHGETIHASRAQDRPTPMAGPQRWIIPIHEAHGERPVLLLTEPRQGALAGTAEAGAQVAVPTTQTLVRVLPEAEETDQFISESLISLR